MVANAAVPASVAAAQATAPAASVPAAAQQPTLIRVPELPPGGIHCPRCYVRASGRHALGPWYCRSGEARLASRAASAPASKPAASAPQPAAAPRLPHLPPCAAPSPSPTLPLRLLPPVLPETPAVEDAGDCSAIGPRLSVRGKARQASYAGLLLNARATADDGSKLTVSFPAGSTFAIKMLGRTDTAVGGPADGLRGSIVAPSTTS